MVSEAIRHWEEDEIKNEGETVDQEYGTFEHAACLGSETAPNDIRNNIFFNIYKIQERTIYDPLCTK